MFGRSFSGQQQTVAQQSSTTVLPKDGQISCLYTNRSDLILSVHGINVTRRSEIKQIEQIIIQVNNLSGIPGKNIFVPIIIHITRSPGKTNCSDVLDP